MNRIELTCAQSDRELHSEIELSTQSPWSSIFGPIPLPVVGSLDQLNQQLAGSSLQQATLRGHPASCLLPILWIRSIWGSETNTRITLNWDCTANMNPAPSTYQPAARLACLLADSVRCNSSDAVLQEYGFDPCNPGMTEDIFDLLTNIVDLWDPNLRSAVLGDDWTSEMRSALTQASNDGHQQVALYGAGTHTRAIGEALMSPPVEIACIIDDDARRYGERLWGFEIMPPEAAIEQGVDAVVLSANSIEDQLWEKTAEIRSRGVQVYRLYGSSSSVGDLTHATH